MSNELLIEHNAHMLQEAFRLTQKCGDFEWSMEGCDNNWASASVCPPLWTSIATAKYYVRRVSPVVVVTEDDKQAQHNLEMQAKAAELLKTDGDYLWSYGGDPHILYTCSRPSWVGRQFKYDVKPVPKLETKQDKLLKHNTEMQAKADELLKTDGDYLWSYDGLRHDCFYSHCKPTWDDKERRYEVRPVPKSEYVEYTDIDQVQLGRWAQWTNKGSVHRGPVSACVADSLLYVAVGPWPMRTVFALYGAVYLDENFKPTNEPLGQLKKASS